MTPYQPGGGGASSASATTNCYYFERQRQPFYRVGGWTNCGLHALHNLLGRPYFTQQSLQEIAAQVDDSWWTRLGIGYYDVNTLQIALLQRNMQTTYFDNRQPLDSLTTSWHEDNGNDVNANHGQFVGLLLNTPSHRRISSFLGGRHWTCIRKLDDDTTNDNAMTAATSTLSFLYCDSSAPSPVRWNEQQCLAHLHDRQVEHGTNDLTILIIHTRVI